jgi:protein ImuB
MKRVVSVWLPDWPVTVWTKANGTPGAPAKPDQAPGAPPPKPAPFVLTDRGARGVTLHALNDGARSLGLHRGQNHADACAIAPHLVSAPAEPERDREALRRLALWAERFSPAVAADTTLPGQEGLFLDMTGGTHLFGGEAAMLADLRRRLAVAGIPARLAIADTPGAAWALARFSVEAEVIAPSGRTREAIAGLPMEGLRLADDALVLLRRFGLKRIGELYGLPRAGLARRFRGEAGLRLVERLDQALGVSGEALEPVRPAPAYRAFMVFAEPVTHIEGIAFRAPDLARALAEHLGRDGRGVRRLALIGFRVDGRTTAIEATLSAPADAPEHMLRLLREKGLEHLDLGFGIDALMLVARQAEPMRARQNEMAEDGRGAAAAPEALAGLIDRLQARLGEGAVRRPQTRESWVPERSEAWVRAGPEAPSAGVVQIDRPRPILLLDPPESVVALAELPDGVPARFIWRRADRRVVKAQGPERLGAEWWRPEPGLMNRPARTRDYYRVEDDQGHRYWLFREGLYAREDADHKPSWWLHGVFG